MKKVLIFAVLGILTPLLGACATMPGMDSTEVMFRFETYNTQLQAADYPVSVTYLIPDYAPWAPEPATPTPYNFVITSKEHSQVKFGVQAAVHVAGPPGTMVVCTWTAKTPGGIRSSERSTGGEGSATVPQGDSEAIAYCEYKA